MNHSRTYKLTIMAMLAAIGTVSAHLLWFPAGVAKAYPIQHVVNVLTAVLLGPGPAVIVAFVIGLLRNLLGVGTLLAFPGGMIGAFLAGYLYKRYGKVVLAACGEVIGTGILASLVAVPYAKVFMNTAVGAFYFLPSFFISSATGALIGITVVKLLKQHPNFQIEQSRYNIR